MSLSDHLSAPMNGRRWLHRLDSYMSVDERAGQRHYGLVSKLTGRMIVSVTVYDNVWNTGRQR